MEALVTFNTRHINEVERGIAPPMGMTVTIPVEVFHNGRSVKGVTLYLGTSAFSPPVSQAVFKEVIAAVVAQLEAREG